VGDLTQCSFFKEETMKRALRKKTEDAFEHTPRLKLVNDCFQLRPNCAQTKWPRQFKWSQLTSKRNIRFEAVTETHSVPKVVVKLTVKLQLK
jgi:hypothetical protein